MTVTSYSREQQTQHISFLKLRSKDQPQKSTFGGALSKNTNRFRDSTLMLPSLQSLFFLAVLVFYRGAPAGAEAPYLFSQLDLADNQIHVAFSERGGSAVKSSWQGSNLSHLQVVTKDDNSTFETDSLHLRKENEGKLHYLSGFLDPTGPTFLTGFVDLGSIGNDPSVEYQYTASAQVAVNPGYTLGKDVDIKHDHWDHFFVPVLHQHIDLMIEGDFHIALRNHNMEDDEPSMVYEVAVVLGKAFDETTDERGHPPVQVCLYKAEGFNGEPLRCEQKPLPKKSSKVKKIHLTLDSPLDPCGAYYALANTTLTKPGSSKTIEFWASTFATMQGKKCLERSLPISTFYGVQPAEASSTSAPKTAPKAILIFVVAGVLGFSIGCLLSRVLNKDQRTFGTSGSGAKTVIKPNLHPSDSGYRDDDDDDGMELA